jgi:hypothetical protein
MSQWFFRATIPYLFNVGALNGDPITRMGWPTDPKAYETLKGMGVKTRINFRTAHSDEAECAIVGIKYIPFPIDEAAPAPWSELDKGIEIMADKSLWPMAVGCAAGSDRTGIMCLRYRVEKMGWSVEDAIEEFLNYVNPQMRIPELWPGINARINELRKG